jgi:hypothetical protein
MFLMMNCRSGACLNSMPTPCCFGGAGGACNPARYRFGQHNFFIAIASYQVEHILQASPQYFAALIPSWVGPRWEDARRVWCPQPPLHGSPQARNSVFRAGM